MSITQLRDKLVAVLGYGQEGKATAAYLTKHGIKPVLFDQRPWQEWSRQEQEQIKTLDLNFIFGPDCFKEMAGFDYYFRSPGINPQTLAVFSKRAAGSSQTSWFLEHSPAPVTGITGTKGKGTTTSLLYEIFSAQLASGAGKAYLTGNIGKRQALEFLDDLSEKDKVAYEMSSFQLADAATSPSVAVVLMVTKEHLDYHGNERSYIEAKSHIAQHQKTSDSVIINADYPNSLAVGESGRGRRYYFSTKQQHGDCYVAGESFVCSLLGKEAIAEASELQLLGRHNWENVCAAILAAAVSGCGIDPIRKALRNFKGLEHRLEYVCEKRGVKFYNDSFATTPETSAAALAALPGPLILILGGSSKLSDFSGLGKELKKSDKLKAVVLIGQEAPRLKAALAGFSGPVAEGAQNMKEIFHQLEKIAEPGDTVALSPACASFGMFENYQDRGRQFKLAAAEF